MLKVVLIRVANETLLISRLRLVLFITLILFLSILNGVLKCVLNGRFVYYWRTYYILTGPVLINFVDRVLVLVIVYNFTNQLLQGIEPHPENCAHFCKAIYVIRIVMFAHVANIGNEWLREVVAIQIDWIVQFTSPIIPKVVSYAVNFLQVEICWAHGYWLFQSQTSAVPLQNDDRSRGIFIMTSITEFEIIQSNWCVIQSKAKKLQDIVKLRHVIDVQVDCFFVALIVKLI